MVVCSVPNSDTVGKHDTRMISSTWVILFMGETWKLGVRHCVFIIDSNTCYASQEYDHTEGEVAGI